MSITVLKRSSKGMRSIKLGNGLLYSVAFMLVLLPTAAGIGGFYYASSKDKAAKVEATTIDSWRSEMQSQWDEIEAAKNASDQQVSALAARLGMLQAHVRRLDAAGERILTIAGIDKKEFNFGETPAVGGPEQSLALASNANLDDAFAQVDKTLASRQQMLDVLESLLMDKHMGVERYISGRPTTRGWLSSFYGTRNDPFTGKPAWHAGIDFAGSEGDIVRSTAAGVVSWVGPRSGYGLLIEINHGDGFVTRYGHNKTAKVKKGDVVKKGQAISTMGNTGRSTGVHVHYEVIKNGRPTDPAPYVNRKAPKKLVRKS